MEQYIAGHWQYFMAAFYVIEKILKLTPTKYDDILVDVVWSGVKKLVKK